MGKRFFLTGGKGNHFFVSNNEKAPQVCEYGAHGEDSAYILELRSMAHLGLVSEFNNSLTLHEIKISKKHFEYVCL